MNGLVRVSRDFADHVVSGRVFCDVVEEELARTGNQRIFPVIYGDAVVKPEFSEWGRGSVRHEDGRCGPALVWGLHPRNILS